MPVEQDIIYQPGEKGQYVFTGQRPRSPEATVVDAAGEESVPPVIPPLVPFDSPPPLPARRTDDDGFTPPSFRPSAY
jgi:hypothetical protein